MLLNKKNQNHKRTKVKTKMKVERRNQKKKEMKTNSKRMLMKTILIDECIFVI